MEEEEDEFMQMPSLPVVSDESEEEKPEDIKERTVSKKSAAKSKNSKKRSKIQKESTPSEVNDN